MTRWLILQARSHMISGYKNINMNLLVVSAGTAYNFTYLPTQYLFATGEKLREDIQEGSSSLLASTSACCDSAVMIPDYFILPSHFMLLWISEMAKRLFRRCRVVEKYSRPQ